MPDTWVVVEAYGEPLEGAGVGDKIVDPIELLRKDPRLHMQLQGLDEAPDHGPWLNLSPAAVGAHYGPPRTLILMEDD